MLAIILILGVVSVLGASASNFYVAAPAGLLFVILGFAELMMRLTEGYA